MAYSLVGSASGRAATDPSTTGTVDTTGADLLVIIVAHNTTAGGTPAVSDSKGNSWTPLTSYNAGASGMNIRMYYSVPSSVGSGHTASFTTSGSFVYASIFLLAFSGAHASPFEEENGATTNANTVLQPGSVTPDQDGSLIITAFSFAHTTAAITISGDGFTTVEETTSGEPENGANRGSWDYLIQGSAGAVNPTWASDTSIACAATIAVFKPAVAGPADLQVLIGEPICGSSVLN